MLRESVTAVVARNETWIGTAATEPYEAGWATEAVFFVRALKASTGPVVEAAVEMSPDGMRWVSEGTTLTLPREVDAIAMARIRHFGNWLRLSATLPDGASNTLLITLHLK